MRAKMEASGMSTACQLDPKMLRRPLYWQMRSVRVYFYLLTPMPHTPHLVGIVIC